DGHEVVEADLAFAPGYHADFRTVWTSALTRVPLAERTEGLLGPLSAHFLELARGYSESFLSESVERLTAWAADARRQLAAHDVVLTPMLAFAPPAIGAFTSLPPAEDY